jgi:glutamyl-tRNA(Gln) amidotransferase subunit E
MPLIETVTYPDMLTPDEAAEAGHYLRFLARSSGLVRTGIGAAREDVNVSITGGTRVEIKGVQHIRWIPELTHNEAFRQKALLLIRDELTQRGVTPESWRISSVELTPGLFDLDHVPLQKARGRGEKVIAVNLPKFGGILSHFTQPGQVFADEISGRLKVVACIEKPNLLHAEDEVIASNNSASSQLRNILKASDEDAQMLIWGPAEDIPTALETIEERCQLAMQGVPNETRKSLPDGTTIFERVLPGPDRMYPDTDSPPLPLSEDFIAGCQEELPLPVSERQRQLVQWGVPEDCHEYLLSKNLLPTLDKIIGECPFEPKFVATVFGHTLKSLEGRLKPVAPFSYNRVYGLLKFVCERNLVAEIVKEMLPVLCSHPNMEFESILNTIGYQQRTPAEIESYVPIFKAKFAEIHHSGEPAAEVRWVMGNLRKLALGNMPMRELSAKVEAAS